ncbi:MAG: methionine synthase, partial [Chloroflexi bacterium]|nr:methionine synthase [Chloroflexota bacterium]
MKRKGNFGCLPTAIGSMPHTDPVAACREVARYLPEIPAWPQLPARSPLEGMYAQFSEGFPGLQADEGRFVIDRSGAFDAELEKLYQAYISGDLDCCPTGPGHAAGLHAFLSMRDLAPVAVKGQITGPITWGLGVTDREGRPVLYDDTLADAVAKFLRLKAAWQEKQLRTVARHTIIFVDEP